tara:strand:+ start:77 stop:1006 length:930 start_codon:yes stop_codon:yes gene_type:complete
MEKDSYIYVAGHNGLVGSSIVRKLKCKGYKNIITANKSDLDLTNMFKVERFFFENKIEYVFDAAAKVGGIHANDRFSAEFIYQNTMIQSNLINTAFKNNIKKFLFLGSVCIYPKFAPTPVKEQSLLCGQLEPTNEAYAISKIHGIHLLKAYNKQYGFKGVSLMPCNLYGPNDNFHHLNSHVIPALIRKLHFGGNGPVECWGDGSPSREFMYVDDLADACLFSMQNFEDAELVNIGSGENIKIKDLAEMISKITGYKGSIYWNKEKPNGTPNRPLDCTLISSLGWKPSYKLEDGLKLSYDWFKNNYENIC